MWIRPARERTALSRPYAIPDDGQYLPTYPGVDFRPEIFAWGLRNPWRFSFDRQTGDLWIGDVGQNLWEEIDFVAGDAIPANGYNFGWNVMEGTHPYPEDSTPEDTSTFTAPIDRVRPLGRRLRDRRLRLPRRRVPRT